MNKEINAIDIMKWICAWMVVVIHSIPLKPYSQIADLYTAQGICRLAVPLFFASSSYLLFRKLGNGREKDTRIMLKYCGHIGRLYVAWSIVYIAARVPGWVLNDEVSKQLVLEQLRKFFFEASYYHFGIC